MRHHTSDPRVRQGRYLSAVLSAAFHGVQPVKKPADISWRDLYELSIHQQVDCIVFSVVKNILKTEDAPLYETWNRQYKFGIYHGFRQMEECDRLVQALTGHGIRTLPLKGSVLKKLYPEIHYRQMGDIDLLVEEKNRDLVDAAVLELGYELKERQSAEHHDVYVKPPNFNLEVHYNIIPVWSEFCPYYENLWERLLWNADNPLLGEMSAEDMYIYMLVHFANHIRMEGQNVRILTDLYVWNRKMGARMDETAVAEQIKKMGLAELREQAETLSRAWLAETPGEMPEVPREVEQLEWKLLASCVDEGFEVRMFNEKQRFKESFHKPLRENISNAIQFVFPPRSTMALYYPFVMEKPYTLPITWVRRWGWIVVLLVKGYAEIRKRKKKR